MKSNIKIFLLIKLSLTINIYASSAVPSPLDSDIKTHAEQVPAYSLDQLQQKLAALLKEKEVLSFQYGMAHNAKVSKAFAVNANACKLLTLKSLAKPELESNEIEIHLKRSSEKQDQLKDEFSDASKEYTAYRQLYINLHERIELVQNLITLAKPRTKKMPPFLRRHSYPK